MTGLTQRELAQRVGMTQGGLSLVESDRRHLSFDRAIKLAEALGVTLDTLAGVDTSGVDPMAASYRRGAWEMRRRIVAALDDATADLVPLPEADLRQ